MIKGRIKERWRRLAGADMSQNKHPENRTFSRRQKWAGLFHRALSESMPPTLRHPFLLQNNILVHNLRGNTASNWLVLVCIITGNANRTVMTSLFFLSNAWWCELSGSRRHHEPGVRFANFIESHKTSISFFFLSKNSIPTSGHAALIFSFLINVSGLDNSGWIILFRKQVFSYGELSFECNGSPAKYIKWGCCFLSFFRETMGHVMFRLLDCKSDNK